MTHIERTNSIILSSLYKIPDEKIRIAFHEAGHAAAIYYNNRQHNLPITYFNIYINSIAGDTQSDSQGESYGARIEGGGRLIKSLPRSIGDFGKLYLAQKSVEEKDEILTELESAMDADICNLLVGSIAEAKYVSIVDNEYLTVNLLSMGALKNYGGDRDLKLIEDYLQCFFNSGRQSAKKARELFLTAFDFVDSTRRWRSIAALATFILKSKNIIKYKDIIRVLDEADLPASYSLCMRWV